MSGSHATYQLGHMVHRDSSCLFVACLTSQQHASVSQGPTCSHKYMCCHSEIYKLQIKLSNLSSDSMLTPGRPVPALNLVCQAPGIVGTGVPIFKSLV